MRRGVMREVQPARVWLEVDLRRACAQLLRSAARAPAITPGGRIDFGMRELVYVADGSPQQRRLAALLEKTSPAAHARVAFSVYCLAGGKRPVDGEEEEAPVGGEAQLPLLVGRAHVSLAALHESGGEMLCEPLELRDATDEVHARARAAHRHTHRTALTRRTRTRRTHEAHRTHAPLRTQPHA